MMGRKTKYSKERVQQICDLIIEDTYTIREICARVGIGETTFHEWQDEKPEFALALEKAREKAIEKFATVAKNSLMRLIEGYTVEEKKTVAVDTGKKTEDGRPIVKVKEQVTTTKHIQPNAAAVIFTLTNCDPTRWRNRQYVDTLPSKPNNSKAILPSDLPREELTRLLVS